MLSGLLSFLLVVGVSEVRGKPHAHLSSCAERFVGCLIARSSAASRQVGSSSSGKLLTPRLAGLGRTATMPISSGPATNSNRCGVGDQRILQRRRAGLGASVRGGIANQAPSDCQVALPAPLGRRRCGSTGADRLRLLGLARVTLMPTFGPAGLGEIATPRPVTLATRVSALGRSPCVSERASFEVPGCGHASCCSACGSVPASACSLARRGRSVRQPSGSPAMPRSEDRWRPACRPLATARAWRVTFHPYKGTNGAEPWRQAPGRRSRSPGKGLVARLGRVAGICGAVAACRRPG